ncbi:hypothetical protein DCAR_0205691 [Daucus carota subsp. sativus]|uniref:PGG domain-containing protein n=1 Tax=Daucus carota subsp. sativus TaxID=79200 RepID=A0AAF0WAQ4_DAUCS|nr:hypothetical protein DCAR_0205691 [Daucus carota subsp. sativus]
MRNTALHVAVLNGNVAIVKLLVEADPSDRHIQNYEGKTPIYIAAEKGYLAIIKEICTACTAQSLEGPGGSASALHALIKNMQDSVLGLLKGRKHLVTFSEAEGWTPLHYAAYHEFVSILGPLIEAQKDVGYQFVYRDMVSTPFHVAVEHGYTSTVIQLVKLWPSTSSAYTAVNKDSQNILHLAAAKNNKNMVQGILKHCPQKYKDQLLQQQDVNGDTPLHLLISNGCFVPELIEHKGLNTMVKNKKSWTPRDMLYSKDDIIAEQKILAEKKDFIFDKYTKILIDEKNAQMKKDLERYKKRTNTQIVVSALITTVTFTVGFTMPGGLHQSGEVDEGLVILSKKTAFNAFMVSDALALLLSTCSLFLYFLESMYEDPRQVSKLNAASTGLNIVSVMAMMLTFITGTYVVLSHSPAIAITVCLIGSFFFLFVIVLLIKMIYDRQVKRNAD